MDRTPHIAIYAGSFDPLTNGHMWMIEQGARLFDELIVAIGVNPEKRCAFDAATRFKMLVDSANRFPNVRAVVYYGEAQYVVDDGANIIIRSREHNDSNVLSLGARYLTEETMMNAVNTWLNTPYSEGERHIRRLGKIDKIKIDN